MEQNNKKKKETGIYIAVCCCVMVLGITGYITNRNKTAKFEETVPLPTQEIAKISYTEQPTDFPDVNPTENPLPVQKAETVIETITDPDDIDIVEVGEPAEFYNDSVITSVTQNPDPTFIMPIKGEIGEAFSADALVFNEKLGDWRTHNGIDIICDENTEALVCADGVIKSIYEDYKGINVVLSHANGYESVYSCLKNADHLKEGVDVLQGDVLAAVSGTPQGENVTKPHLHFEIYYNSTPQNPSDIVTQ